MHAHSNMYQIAQTAHPYVDTYGRTRVPLVATIVGVGAYDGVHCKRRLDRLAQEQVRLHELIRSDDRNQSLTT